MKVSLLALVALSAACCAQTKDDDLEIGLTGPLVRAGVNLDDAAALIRVLQHSKEDSRLATCAAYVLGKLPKNAVILRELNIAAQAEDEILMNYAIRSLLKFGDRGWVPGAAARLPTVRDERQRIHLAGELAQVERYDGWSMIEAAIVSGEVWRQDTALFEVGNFRGMKDTYGKPIDLLAKLDELRLRTPTEQGRAAIFRAIVRLGEPASRQPKGVKKSLQ